MTQITILEWSAIVMICVATAIAAVRILLVGIRNNQAPLFEASGDAAVWLFDSDELISASTATNRYIAENPHNLTWDTLRGALVDRFPGFPDSPGKVRQLTYVMVAAGTENDAAKIELEYLDGVIRVAINDPDLPNRSETETLPNNVLDELERLRDTVEKLPSPVWRMEAEGKVTWKNAAYMALEDQTDHDGKDTSLFPVIYDEFRAHGRRRLPLEFSDGSRSWYDVSQVTSSVGLLCYAVDVSAVVDAQSAQRNFVQTLAKTFAQLSIGLAIFDRNRQLALFNPALIDLTNLPAEFLSGRPTLPTFFDHLRDKRIMPEPKNYFDWRQEMADLVKAAADGRYLETWSLPSGSVYSVSGRPHPDGAIAFLIEDITAEITLTRRFRSDLELGQSILDHVGEGIVVFGADGIVSLSNATYRAIWDSDPDEGFTHSVVTDMTRMWQENCQPSPIWGEIRDFVSMRENRAEWTAEVTHKRIGPILLRVTPLPNGATMIGFIRGAGSDNGLISSNPENAA